MHFDLSINTYLRLKIIVVKGGGHFWPEMTNLIFLYLYIRNRLKPGLSTKTVEFVFACCEIHNSHFMFIEI